MERQEQCFWETVFFITSTGNGHLSKSWSLRDACPYSEGESALSKTQEQRHPKKYQEPGSLYILQHSSEPRVSQPFLSSQSLFVHLYSYNVEQNNLRSITEDAEMVLTICKLWDGNEEHALSPLLRVSRYQDEPTALNAFFYFLFGNNLLGWENFCCLALCIFESQVME